MVPSVPPIGRPAVSLDPDPRLRADEAARLLGVTTETVRRWVKLGLLPVERLGPGRRILIDPSDLARLSSRDIASKVGVR